MLTVAAGVVLGGLILGFLYLLASLATTAEGRRIAAGLIALGILAIAGLYFLLTALLA